MKTTSKKKVTSKTGNEIPHDRYNKCGIVHTRKQKRQHFHAKMTVHWQSTHGTGHIPLCGIFFCYDPCPHTCAWIINVCVCDKIWGGGLFKPKRGWLGCSLYLRSIILKLETKKYFVFGVELHLKLDLRWKICIWLILPRSNPPLEICRWFPQIVFILPTRVRPIKVGFSNRFFCWSDKRCLMLIIKKYVEEEKF